jgi:putative flippase GtrA
MTRADLGPLLRFCAVGSAAALASLACLAVFKEVVGLPYLTAFLASFFVVNGAAYLASRSFAFPGSRMPMAKGMLRFLVLAAGSLAVNSLLLVLLVDGLGLWYLLAAALLTVANAPVNFLLHRRYSFDAVQRPAGPQ